MFPIVLYLRGGNISLSREEYRADLFGREVLRFRYESVRLERLKAKEYLGRGDPVAAALAALMERSADDDIAQLRATMMQEVVSREIGDAREFVLVDIIETYCTLTDDQAARYRRLISRKEYRRVLDTELTWADKLLLKGELKGKRETLLRLLERKFGPMTEEVAARIAAEESATVIDGWLEGILSASSLEDLGLSG